MRVSENSSSNGNIAPLFDDVFHSAQRRVLFTVRGKNDSILAMVSTTVTREDYINQRVMPLGTSISLLLGAV